MRAKLMLCFYNSRIKSEGLASKINCPPVAFAAVCSKGVFRRHDLVVLT